MTVATTQAKRLHQKAVVCASTGNTSASLLIRVGGGNNGVSADSQRKCCRRKNFPGTCLRDKALVVNGDFDDCMRLIFEAQEKLQAYPLNWINPFRLEGQKTIIWETLQQLEWKVPDWFVFPGGNLGNASALEKRCTKLYSLV